MSYKAIEIFYDIESIPGIDPNKISPTDALDFRNEAMELIEAALLESGLGNWVGAEIGMDEVNFGFEVDDFEEAENLVRKSVAGTKFENIREISQFESDDENEDEGDDGDLIDRDEIAEALRSVGFEAAEQLALTAAICQRILPIATIDASELSDEEETRLGGVPDVPASFDWPRRNGKPLAFLAQIDYWQESQRLLFFYDVADAPSGYSPLDRDSGRVIMVDNEGLSPAVAPDDLPSNCQFPKVEMAMQTDVVLPNYASSLIKNLNIPKKDLQLLKKLSDEPNDDDTASHHLMGHPSLVTEDMEIIVQLAANGIDANDPNLKSSPDYETYCQEAENWHLLFQCDADPLLGFDWGNSGRLFFWIDGLDYEEQNFNNVWVIRQSKPE